MATIGNLFFAARLLHEFHFGPIENGSLMIHATAACCLLRFTLPPGLALKNLQYLDSGEVVQARDAKDGSGLMVRWKGLCVGCHLARPKALR